MLIYKNFIERGLVSTVFIATGPMIFAVLKVVLTSFNQILFQTEPYFQVISVVG